MTDLQFFLLLAMAAAGVITTIRTGNKTMATQQDLQAEIAQLETASQAANANTKQAFAHLETKIASGAPDLQPEIDRLRAVLGIENDTNAAAQAIIAQG
jgi:uncharacterized small protein (DUF1192 family)